MKRMKSEMFHATNSLSLLFLHCYFIIHCKSLVLPAHKHAEKSTVHIQGDVLNLRPKVEIFNCLFQNQMARTFLSHSIKTARRDRADCYLIIYIELELNIFTNLYLSTINLRTFIFVFIFHISLILTIKLCFSKVANIKY